jgi:hypothetical protein
MLHKHYVQILLLTALSGLGLIFGLNLAVDPYSVLGTSQLKYTFQPNERYLKIEYLAQHRNQFDSYLMGSSRIGTTNPHDVQKYFPDSHFYNLSASISSTYDHLKHLEYLLISGKRPRHLYIGLDVDLGLTDFSHDAHQLLTRLHPDVPRQDKAQSRMMYWLEFAASFQPRVTHEKIWKNLFADTQSGYLDLNMATGAWSRPMQLARIASNPADYIREEPSFHQHNARIVKNIRGRDNLQTLQKIRGICLQHGISLTVFITPHHRAIMDSIDENDYLAWLRELAAITPFWNFSGYNSVTLDDRNYLESSHYLPRIGTLIAARIFNDGKVVTPVDFGIRVNASNIEAYLSTLRHQIRQHDARRFRQANSSAE